MTDVDTNCKTLAGFKVIEQRPGAIPEVLRSTTVLAEGVPIVVLEGANGTVTAVNRPNDHYEFAWTGFERWLFDMPWHSVRSKQWRVRRAILRAARSSAKKSQLLTD